MTRYRPQSPEAGNPSFARRQTHFDSGQWWLLPGVSPEKVPGLLGEGELGSAPGRGLPR